MINFKANAVLRFTFSKDVSYLHVQDKTSYSYLGMYGIPFKSYYTSIYWGTCYDKFIDNDGTFQSFISFYHEHLTGLLTTY